MESLWKRLLWNLTVINCYVGITEVNRTVLLIPVYLKEGQLLGVVQEMSKEVAEETHVRALQAVGSNSQSVQGDGYQRLLEALN